MKNLNLYIERITWFCMLIYCICSYFPAAAVEPEKGKRPRCLKSDDYMKWVESKQNGLSAKASSGILDFFVQYKPLDYIVLKELGTNKNELTKKGLRKRKREIEGMEYYTFTIGLNDGRKDLIKCLSKTSGDYEKTLLYFANRLQQDLKLVIGKDTTDCNLFHFERTYGITPYVKFVLGFEKFSSDKDKKENRTLLFFGKMLGTDVIPMSLRKEDIHNIPKLVFRD